VRGDSHRPAVPGPERTSGSWDAFSPARPFQSLWVALGALAAMPGLAATYLRLVPPTDDVPNLLAAFVPYAVVAYLLSSLFLGIALLRARRRAVLAVATVLTLTLLCCHLAWLAPLFIADQRPASTRAFALMTLNTRHGAADPRQVAEQASQADVVVLLEATPALIDGLQRHAWSERFPYSIGELRGEYGDTVVYSRFPLSNQAPLPNSEYQTWIANAVVPDIGTVRIIAAHPCNPFCGNNRFSTDHQELRGAADANLGVPLIVAGDLNAVDDHAPLRALRRDGLVSATDIVGAGWLPTYPANQTIPPLLPIDHILVNRFLTATSLSSFDVDGTDHRGLLAQIAGTR
jgi:endonuclease/exonuclease/phosphatase (EEP) superfamily protein YafD